MRIIYSIVAFWLLCVSPGFAATYTCGTNGVDDSCTIAGLNTLIGSASDDDTINIATGTHNWTPSGSSRVLINKRITISGGGSCSDCGTVAQASGVWPTRINVPSGNTVHPFVLAVTSGSEGVGLARITGLDLRGGSYIGTMGCVSTGGLIKVSQTHIAQFRIDNNRIECTANQDINGDIWVCNEQVGLIDNNYFYNQYSKGKTIVALKLQPAGYPTSWEGECSSGWTDSVNWGGSDWLFIEDNTAYRPGNDYSGLLLDTWCGTRIVIRYNYLSNNYSESHGFSFGTWSTPGYAVEYYNNVQTTSGNGYRAYWVRGGTGLFYDNTISGTWGNGVWQFDDGCTGYGRRDGTEWGDCDGTKDWDGNCEADGLAYNTNVDPTTDLTAFPWQCGDSSAEYFTNYPKIMQVGWGKIANISHTLVQPEEWMPVRIWSNTYNTGSSLGLPSTSHDQQFALNRDVFHSSDNSVAQPDYTPYTYPHPLRDEGTTPSTMSGVTITGGSVQ